MPTLLTVEGDPDYNKRLEMAMEAISQGAKAVAIKLEDGQWGYIIVAEAEFTDTEIELLKDPDKLKQIVLEAAKPQ